MWHLLLSNAEAEAVERHLLGCAICQKKIDEIQQVFTALADLPEMPYQKDLITRVLRLVEPPPAAVPERKPMRKFPGWASGLAWAIAVLEVPLAGLALRIYLAYATGLVWLPSDRTSASGGKGFH